LTEFSARRAFDYYGFVICANLSLICGNLRFKNMADKTVEQTIKECDRQLDSLYAHFGKFLYENIRKENIYYCFESQDGHLEEQAHEFLQKIKYYPGSESKIQASLTGIDTPTSKIADQETKPQKRELAQEGVQGKEIKPVEKRGSIEPYTKLIIELHKVKNKLMRLKEDADEYLSLAMLHIKDAETENLVSGLKEIENRLILYIEKNVEAVKDIMEKKKKFIDPSGRLRVNPVFRQAHLVPRYTQANHSVPRQDASPFNSAQGEVPSKSQGASKDAERSRSKRSRRIEDSRDIPDALAWKAEDEFLKRATADIKNTSKQVDMLVKKASGFFQEIKRSYQKDLEADKLLREGKLKETEEEVVAEEGQEEEKQEEEVEEEREEKQEEAKIEEKEEERDYGLLETASRKLRDETVVEKEKLRFLDTIFRSIPNKAAGFLFDVIEDVDLSLKKQLIELVKEIKSPILIDLYREFINDGDPFLRLNGIIGLRRLGSGEAKGVIISAVNDRDPNIRRLVANCLNCPGSDSELAAIIRLTNDSDGAVARIAIRKLGKSKNRFSFVNLIPKLESPDIKIRKEVIEALQFMTGTDLGYRYSAPEPERKSSIKNWQKLWEKNQTNPHFLGEMIPRDLLVETNKGARLSGTKPSRKNSP